MHVDLDVLNTLISERRYEEAIALCGHLLAEYPERSSEILRERAHAFALSEDHENALNDWRSVVENADARASDYYQAAYRALFVGQFVEAIGWFQTVLLMGEEQRDTWFKSASLFYLSYAELELGNYEEALESLSKSVEIETDVAMPLPKVGICDSDSLRREILRRQSNP